MANDSDRRVRPEPSGDSRSQRVLYLVTSSVSGVLVRGQLSFLQRRGYDVFVGSGGDPTFGSAQPWDDGIRVESVPFVRGISPLRDLRALWSTLRLIRRTRPDIVNASTPKAGLLGMVAARMLRVSVRVYVLRGLRLETLRGGARGLARWSERLTVWCATHVIVNSPSLRSVAEAEAILRPGVGVVLGAGSGNGVDADRFDVAPPERRANTRARIGVDSDDFVVGYVGRLSADKGVGDLVSAFSAAFGEQDDAQLVLVGGYDDVDPIASEARRAIDGDRRVSLHPWVTATEDVYAAFDLVAVPSYREGMPNVALEAQASGLPVVGYAATGTIDAVENGTTGILVDPGDVAALGRAIRSLADDRIRRCAMGAAGRRRVLDSYRPEQVWESLADCYRAWLSDR